MTDTQPSRQAALFLQLVLGLQQSGMMSLGKLMNPISRKIETHLDVARDPPPGAETFDALVSMHTLYWHLAPRALLDGCRRALKPGGHAVFLTYSRPARVGRTFREVWKREGCASALRALRWLVPTALFEMLRDFEPRYLTRDEFHAALAGAGFEILESRETFLAGISLLAWVQKRA